MNRCRYKWDRIYLHETSSCLNCLVETACVDVWEELSLKMGKEISSETSEQRHYSIQCQNSKFQYVLRASFLNLCCLHKCKKQNVSSSFLYIPWPRPRRNQLCKATPFLIS
jgi:hypothetical protein